MSNPRLLKRSLISFSLLILLLLLLPLSADAHNLDQRMNWIQYDDATRELFNTRIAANQDPIQVGDELGMLVKVTPTDGTTTGVGGYVTFYVPDGVQVVDAGYMMPDGDGSYLLTPMKGQAIEPLGYGPIGPAKTSELVGLTLGPNIVGQTSLAVASDGTHLGTLAGVYADTGIFFSEHADTGWQSWVDSTPALGTTIKSNSGDEFVPNNKWDADQMYAWGISDPIGPIVDPNGRGSAPWGMASGVAGPESGYAWGFDLDAWNTTGNMQTSIVEGPWQRIQYSGSQVAFDEPGRTDNTLGFAGIDASQLGWDLHSANPLPSATNAVRWSVGALIEGRPEYLWVKVEVLQSAVYENCATFYVDTFGGDAGGENGGKDHLWRYYDPTDASLDACVAISKRANREVVGNNGVFEYDIEVINTSATLTWTGVQIVDDLPNGVDFLNAFPAANSGPNPLVWNVPSLAPGDKFAATVTVKAASSGLAVNDLCVSADNLDTTCVDEGTYLGSQPLLMQSKLANVSTISAGDQVQYTIYIENIGTGASDSPIEITDYLPLGFEFVSLDSVTVNNANAINVTEVNASNLNRPIFEVDQAINADKRLILLFTAQSPDDATSGATYCNTYSTLAEAVLSTGSEACVTVGGASIGDTVYRDWNDDNDQDADEEGIAGIEVCATGPSGTVCDTTDENGNYLIPGLTPGDYTVTITNPPSGYTPTQSPSNPVNLSNNEEDLTIDFGYLPGGNGAIGDFVFEDKGNDGIYHPTGADGIPGNSDDDLPIHGVTVNLYEDSDGDGVITPLVDALVATTTTSGGSYNFTGLAEGLDYLVDVVDADITSYFSGSAAWQASTDDPISVPNLSGTYNQADFGFFEIVPGSIGDEVFVDANTNGSYQEGIDTPLPFVTVTLYQDSGSTPGVLDNDDVVLQTTQTSITGTYQFENLGPGTYIVDVDETDGAIPDNHETSGNDPIVYTLGLSENYLDADFPFVYVAPPPPPLNKAVNAADANPGDTLYYTVTVDYAGDAMLYNAVVTDAIPEGTTYVPASANAGGTFATSTTVELTSVADTAVFELLATAQGSSTRIGAGSGTPVGEAAAMIGFDVSSIPAGATIDSATLKIVEFSDSNPRVDSVHQMTSAWDETSAIWTTPDGVGTWASGDFSSADYNSAVILGLISNPAPGSAGLKTIDVTAVVDDWINNSVDNDGFAIVYQSGISNLTQYYAREWGTASERPILEVTYSSATNSGELTWNLGSNVPGTPGISVGSSAAPITTTGMAVWADGDNTGRSNVWDGTAFETAGDTVNLGAAQRILAGASAPTRNEKIVIGVDASERVRGQMWDGSTWSALSINDMGTVTDSFWWGFDVAYEQTSGDAILVWNDNSQSAGNKLRYAVWNGSAWTTSPTSISVPLNGEPSQIRLASHPSSDEITAVVASTGGDYALVWNGSSWGNAKILAAATETNAVNPNDDFTDVYVTYEQKSGHAMAVFGKSLTVGSTEWALWYSLWDGSTWTDPAFFQPFDTIAVTARAKWITLGADPTSDRIVAGVISSGGDIWLAVWDGSAWGDLALPVDNTALTNTPVVAVAFESTSGEALAATSYGGATALIVYSRTWDETNGWSGVTGAMLSGDPKNSRILEPDPYSDQIMLAVQDSSSTLNYLLWDGSAWGAPSEQENDTNEIKNQPFLFMWDNVVSVTSSPAQSQDDAEQYVSSGTVSISSSDLEMINDPSNGNQEIGIRFPNLQIPQGATITNAYVDFTAYAASSGATNLTIYGEASDNALAFAATVNNVSNRIETTEMVPWNAIPAWSNFESSADTQTPDISAIVQEIVNRSGWSEGNALVLLITGSGEREACSYDGAASSAECNDINRAPKLVVTYTLASSATLETSINAGPTLVTSGNQITVTMTLTATEDIASVGPNTLVITGTNGVTATLAGGPTPGSNTVGAAGTTFTWVYNTSDTGSIGQLVFGGNADDGGDNTWASAESNSVIVVPPLTFQVTVDNDSGVNPITNIAYLNDDLGTFNDEPSNIVETYLSPTIGDFVWADLDGDGDQDVGEPGLGGVEVCVLPAVVVTPPIVPLECTTTDETGYYQLSVPGISPGGAPYPVLLSVDTIPENYQPTTATELDVVINSASEQYVSADFGLRPPSDGVIGDTIWLDANEDGNIDATETPLANITVNLYNGTNLIATTATDDDGLYQFNGLYAGNYTVEVDPTSIVTTTYGVTTTVDSAMDIVSVAGSSSGTPPLTNTYNVTLVANDSVVDNADFGLNWGGSIGDYVWYDNSGDTIQDNLNDEGGVADVVLLLYYDVDGDGSFKPGTDLPVDFAESANDGSYSFENLPPGDYIVVAEEQTVAAPPSSANAGKFGVMVATTGTKHAVSLSGNQDYALADFGFIESAEVEGHVFHDEDHNGSFDGSEVGLPSVTVTLTGTTDDGTVITLTVATDADGEYKFIVPPGEYVVTYEQSDIPDEYTETTTETSFEVSVDAGQEVDDLDFGVDHGGIIGDTVWYDFLVNGNQDFGEPGLDGVTIELYDNNNELVAITATDDEGHYAFVGLPDGNYTVNPDETTLPPNYILTTANDPYAAEITDGGSDLDADFGYQYFDILGTPVYELSGTVWDDVDGSGDINGETGIPDVRVVVECDTGTYYATTNASGFWQVSGILEGSNCTINADESTLPSTAYQPTTPDELTVTNITSDQADLDFGYQEQLGSVAGTVCEGDTSGSCGAGELPLPGVTVTLNYAGQDGRFGTSDDTTDSTTTLADGSYSFDDLPPGLYQIVETNPATHESISDADGGNPDNISLILVAGADLVDQDFEDRIGQFPSIGNAVWIDENADGIQNPGEPGLANIVVELWDSSGSTLVMTTTTDTNGGYLFKTVLPDIYQVKVDETSLPIGLFVSTLGANPGDDLNNQAQPYSVTVALNDEDLSADFGYIWTDPANVTGNTGNGALGDRIWIDSNGDGVQDPGEAGLPGATVQLYTDPDGNGVYDTPHGAPVVSGPDGSYIFTNLPPAAYVVGVTPPAGYTNTGGPVDQPIVLDPGDVYLNADFGYQPTGITNAITGTVWYDDNADGSQGVDEDPTLGVSVALIDDAGNIIATTITDGNGEYTFSGLPDGTYTVWVNDTENILGELDPTYDADGIVTSNMSTVPVAGGTPAPDQDFGYAPPNHTSTDGLIGDTVFLDRNGNSQPNIGEGMEGIAVGLFDSTGSILLDSTMTDENGHYAFGGLDAGDYVVKVFRETFRSGSETLVNTVDPDAGRADQSAVELSSAEINRLQDFGYAASGGTLIGGTVWEDGNADGTLNETGSGISGVTVVLLDSAGNIVAKTTTASNGSYSFNGVAAGTYTVHITDDDGLLAGHWHTLGTNPGADNNSQVDPYTVVVAANTSNTTADFGYYQQPAGLGDFVWADDGDGIQQALEPGVAGVTVTLSITYPNGIVLTLVTTTDDNGLYSFDNLLLDEGYNGSGGVGVGGDTPQYVVTVAAPESASATLLNQGDGTNDSDDPAGTEAAVIQGVTNDAYDFGFKDAPTAVVLRVASVTDENIPLQAMFIAIILTTMTIGLNMYRRARRE